MDAVFTPEQEARIRELLRDELSKLETLKTLYSALEPTIDKELAAQIAQFAQQPIGGGGSSVAGNRP